MIVIEDHLEIAEPTSELSLLKGDIVYVLERDASGWYGGHKDGETMTGWFPGSKVKEYKGGSWNVPTTPSRSLDGRPVASPLRGHGALQRESHASGEAAMKMEAEKMGRMLTFLQSRVQHL